ncbi:MAG: FumA C-terminus/TtdB family hydratase beta subunit [Proteobacteria bacterium]|nr:FumA C-terminus/TtdB family hydratase beta subunit [Pseudomonadota bacterium]
MEFSYQKPLPLGTDRTPFRLLSKDFVSSDTFNGKKILKIAPEGLELLAREALREIAFFLRPGHLEKLAKILDDPEASDNDRFVAHTLLKNAVIAADTKLPGCQDTGTAVIIGKKGQFVYTGVDDAEYLSRGVFKTYQTENLRYSQLAPQSMFVEKNTGSNLPAQIDLYASNGDTYEFLFLAKGGGSANKTLLFQQTKSLLTEQNLRKFIEDKVKYLGTSACPPYHLALVIGGSSAETCLKVVKEASAGYLDQLPTEGNATGQAFRDLEWEAIVQEICQQTGIGAQFGGKYFVHDVRVIRLPRHAASCPVGLGVSCSADRNIKGKITQEGIFLEVLEHNPKRFLPAKDPILEKPVEINLDQPMPLILKQLSLYPCKTRLKLSGTLIVARDVAHARIQDMLQAGQPMPEYFKQHPIYYAGPAKTPEGMASGSFGPTTAGRMDPYVQNFMQHGGSMIMLAKGNRSSDVTKACKTYGGFYLGSIGGPAAILAKENILSVELVDFADLGMEAIRKIRVKDFPAFIVCDDKGNDFYSNIQGQD